MKAHSEVLAFFLPRQMIARRVPAGVVIDRPEIVLHELGHCERLADETPFRQMEMRLAPGDIELGAGQLRLALIACIPTAAGRSARPCQAGGGCGSGPAPSPRGGGPSPAASGFPATRPWAARKRSFAFAFSSLRLLSRLKILGDGALLHDGGCIGGQERRSSSAKWPGLTLLTAATKAARSASDRPGGGSRRWPRGSSVAIAAADLRGIESS